jgi:hypothetical protein
MALRFIFWFAAPSRVARWFLFKPKNHNFGSFWRALGWTILLYVMAIWNILLTFGICYDHLVHFVFMWNILSGFGIMYQEKSGNPGSIQARKKAAAINFNSPN